MPPGDMDENWWSPEEDFKLIELIKSCGKKWKVISELYGKEMEKPRNPKQCRNRYIRMRKKAQMKSDGRPPNKCTKCGQPKKGHTCILQPSLEKVMSEVEEEGGILPLQEANNEVDPPTNTTSSDFDGMFVSLEALLQEANHNEVESPSNTTSSSTLEFESLEDIDLNMATEEDIDLNGLNEEELIMAAVPNLNEEDAEEDFQPLNLYYNPNDFDWLREQFG